MFFGEIFSKIKPLKIRHHLIWPFNGLPRGECPLYISLYFVYVTVLLIIY